MLDGFFRNIISLEGGSANIAGDRGGFTFMGISTNAYPALAGRIRSGTLSLGEVRDIYLTDYYARIYNYRALEVVAPDLLWLLFTGGVHGSGDDHVVEVVQAWLQANGDTSITKVDGLYGRKTSEAVLKLPSDQLAKMMEHVYSMVEQLASRRALSVGIPKLDESIKQRVRREHKMARSFTRGAIGTNDGSAPVVPLSNQTATIMIDGYIWLEVKVAGQSIFVRQD